MKIRIVQRSHANLTGDYGGVAFKNGVSVEDVPEAYYDRIANSIKVVDAETGEQVGIAVRMLASKTQRIENFKQIERERAEKLRVNRKDPLVGKPLVMPTKTYTEEELGDVVEDKGINGLREIATPLNVRGRSIPDLIRGILAAQGAEDGKSQL